MKGKKKLVDYLVRDDFFIYDRRIISKSDNTNYYWYVCFPEYLYLPNRAFNKQLHTKDEVIKFRDYILRCYIKSAVDSEYKIILEKYLKN